MELAGGTIGFLAAGMVILASLWYLRMEIRNLRQDMHRELGGLGQDMRAVRDGLSRVESMLAGASLTRRS